MVAHVAPFSPAWHGLALRLRREALGLSLAALSDRLAAAGHPSSLASLGRYERGEAAPGADLRKALARIVKCRISDFERAPRVV